MTLAILVVLILVLALSACGTEKVCTWHMACDCGANGYHTDSGEGASCPLHLFCDCDCDVDCTEVER